MTPQRAPDGANRLQRARSGVLVAAAVDTALTIGLVYGPAVAAFDGPPLPAALALGAVVAGLLAGALVRDEPLHGFAAGLAAAALSSPVVLWPARGVLLANPGVALGLAALVLTIAGVAGGTAAAVARRIEYHGAGTRTISE